MAPAYELPCLWAKESWVRPGAVIEGLSYRVHHWAVDGGERGFALNYVTATIAAVSMGVGVDYSIHMTERFREEWGRASTRLEALRHSARGTGLALLASAGSSVVGFAIMGFAPMPMFSSYGFLTAVMIFLALLASLAVLPSLLLLVTREKRSE